MDQCPGEAGFADIGYTRIIKQNEEDIRELAYAKFARKRITETFSSKVVGQTADFFDVCQVYSNMIPSDRRKQLNMVNLKPDPPSANVNAAAAD